MVIWYCVYKILVYKHGNLVEKNFVSARIFDNNGTILHYSGIMMSTMASQITGVSIVFAAILLSRKSKKTPKFRVTGGQWIPRTKGQ